MLVVVSQPCFFPWAGFFRKLIEADHYVILDNVQKNNYINRVKIKYKDEETWLTAPMKKSRRSTKIENLEYVYDRSWREKHLKTLKHLYRRADYFEEIYHFIQKCYVPNLERVSWTNTFIILMILYELGIDIKHSYASHLAISGSRNNMMVNICKALNCDSYLVGHGALDGYHDQSKFDEAGIKVVVDKEYHPVYKQLGEKFISHLSIIDLLFNEGFVGTKKILEEW